MISNLDKLTKKRFKKILAQESAKIIVSQGIENFSDAKTKAAKNESREEKSNRILANSKLVEEMSKLKVSQKKFNL